MVVVARRHHSSNPAEDDFPLHRKQSKISNTTTTTSTTTSPPIQLSKVNAPPSKRKNKQPQPLVLYPDPPLCLPFECVPIKPQAIPSVINVNSMDEASEVSCDLLLLKNEPERPSTPIPPSSMRKFNRKQEAMMDDFWPHPTDADIMDSFESLDTCGFINDCFMEWPSDEENEDTIRTRSRRSACKQQQEAFAMCGFALPSIWDIDDQVDGENRQDSEQRIRNKFSREELLTPSCSSFEDREPDDRVFRRSQP
jgi:hypothetical protein